MKTIKAEVIWEYYDNGQLACEQYWINGELHNPNAPAYKYWYDNGQLKSETYWINDNNLTKEEFDNRNKSDCNGKIVEIDGKKYQLKEI